MTDFNPAIYQLNEVSYLTDETPEDRDRFFAQLKNVPKSIDDFIFSIPIEEKIKAMYEKFQLAETQSMFLTCIIRDVAVGITYYGDIVKLIQDKLDVPEVKARQLAQAITELYDFALEDIKKLQVATFGDRIKQNMEKSESNVIDLRNNP